MGYIIFIVVDDGGVVIRGLGKCFLVVNFFFDVVDNGIFGVLVDGEDVVDVEGSFFIVVDERIGGEIFSSEESFFLEFVLVRVMEDNGSKGSIFVWN